jgi:polysaccharide biosynthesis/export protein
MIQHQLKTTIGILGVLAAMLAWANGVAAQGARVVMPLNSLPSTTKPVAQAAPIAPGDLLDISVFDVPELAQQVRVGVDGKAQLALIGNISLAGLTEEQAAEMIAGELRNRNFLVQPQVKVSIKESSTQGVSVLGEVQHPGIYQVMGPRTLPDLLSMAGGLTNVADSRVTIEHRSAPGGNVTVNLKNDDPKTLLATDLQVYPGDLVVVPRAGIVYVLGDVARPGGFVMQNDGGITLLQALAQAGSVSRTGSGSHAVLLRKVNGEYVTSKVNLDKIARGQQPDFALHANDILFIPNNRLKSALRNTGSIAASIGTVAIAGVVP